MAIEWLMEFAQQIPVLLSQPEMAMFQKLFPQPKQYLAI
jgi:hypothetical protein